MTKHSTPPAVQGSGEASERSLIVKKALAIAEEPIVFKGKVYRITGAFTARKRKDGTWTVRFTVRPDGGDSGTTTYHTVNGLRA